MPISTPALRAGVHARHPSGKFEELLNNGHASLVADEAIHRLVWIFWIEKQAKDALIRLPTHPNRRIEETAAALVDSGRLTALFPCRQDSSAIRIGLRHCLRLIVRYRTPTKNSWTVAGKCA